MVDEVCYPEYSDIPRSNMRGSTVLKTKNLVIFGIPSYNFCKLYIFIFVYKLNVCFRWRK